MKKLYLGRNKMLCGICAGIADYFNIDPTIIRIITVCIAFYTAIAPAFVIYLALGFVFPATPDDYVESVPEKLLVKGKDRKLAGVCAGISEYFRIDVTIVRIIFFIFTFIIGGGLVAYIAAAILMPSNPDDYYTE